MDTLRLVFLFFCFFYIGHLAQAGLYNDVSSLIYSAKNGSCPDAGFSEKQNLNTAIQKCSLSVSHPLLSISQVSDQTIENSFFQIAAEKQAANLKCRASRLSLYKQGIQGLHNIGETLIQDSYKKLKALKQLQEAIHLNSEQQCQLELKERYKQGTEKFRDKKISECIQTKNVQITTSRYDQPTGERLILSQQKTELALAYQAIQSSLVESSDPRMKAWYESQLRELPSEDVFQKKAHNELKNIFSEMVRDNDQAIQDLQKQKKGTTYNLDTGTKEKIMHQPEVLADVHKMISEKSDFNTQTYSNLMCRLDSRYGRGSDYLDVAIGISSLVFFIPTGGSTSLLSASLIARGGMAGRTAITLGRSARVVAGGGLVAQTAHEVEKACLSKAPLHSVTGDVCSSADYEAKQFHETNCALEVILQGSPYLAGLGLAIQKSAITKNLIKSAQEKSKDPTHSRSFTEIVSDAGVKGYTTPSSLSMNVSNSELLQASIQLQRDAEKLKVKTKDYTGDHAGFIKGSSKAYQFQDDSKNYTKMKVITELPQQKGPRSPETLALIHPDMDEYLKKAQKLGVQIVLDPTLKFSKNILAGYSPKTNTIHIRPDSSFQHFRHEFEHAQLETAMKPYWNQSRHAIQEGKSLNEVLPPSVQSDLGKERVDKLDGLLKKEKTYIDIHETLAVDSELELLGFRHIINGDKANTATYKHYHNIEGIESSIIKAKAPAPENWDYEKLQKVRDHYQFRINTLEREKADQKKIDQLRQEYQDATQKIISGDREKQEVERQIKIKNLEDDLTEAKKNMARDLLITYGAKTTQKAIQIGTKIDAIINNIEPTVEKVYQYKNGDLYILHKNGKWEVVKAKN